MRIFKKFSGIKASKQQCLSGHKMVSERLVKYRFQAFAQLVRSGLISIRGLTVPTERPGYFSIPVFFKNLMERPISSYDDTGLEVFGLF